MSDTGGEKDQKPTAQKIKEAREQGQVARTSELGPALAFLFVASALTVGGARPWIEPFQAYQRALDAAASTDFTAASGMRIVEIAVLAWLPTVALLLGAAAAGAILSQLLQGGPNPTATPLKLDISKMSPIKKIKSMVGAKHYWQTFRGVLSGVFALWIIGSALRDLAPDLPGLTFITSAAIGEHIGAIVVRVAWRAGFALVVLGIIDLLMAHYLHIRGLRMSREDLKKEQKNQEGSPEVRSQRRRRAIELSRAGNLQNVARADVVVTNPTHYAVALTYRRGLMTAPRVVAKGRNKLAQKIRIEAIKHEVPIVENPPLARELYAKVPLDGEVPPEMFLAVAEVIAFIMRLNQTTAGGAGAAAIPPGSQPPGADVEAR